MRPAIVLFMLLATATLVVGDAPECGRELLRLVPRLEPQIAFHLLHDDDAAFRRFGRAIGQARIFDAVEPISTGIRVDSHREYDRTSRFLYPYLSRVTDVLASEYDRPEFARLYAFRASLGPLGFLHRRMILALESLQGDVVVGFDEKIARYRAFAAGFERIGDTRMPMEIEAALARDVMRVGLMDKRMQLLESALWRARVLGEQVEICQLLGELGDAHRTLGDPGTMMRCYAEGIARADRYGIRDQAARLRGFLADYYFSVGRFTAGADLLREAQATSQRLGGSPLEIRIVLSAMVHYARLGCWDLVGRSAERIPVLLRALERDDYRREAIRYRMIAKLLQAEWLAATGHPEAAADSLAGLYQALRHTADRDVLPAVLEQYAEVQLQNGRAAESLDLAVNGTSIADSLHLPELRRELAIARVRAALALRRPDLATQALAEASAAIAPGADAAPTPAYVLNGLAARIACLRGRPREALAHLLSGLSELRGALAKLDHAPDSDLSLADARDLWLAGNTLAGNSPDASLAFERYRRSLVGSIGAPASVRVSSAGSSLAGPESDKDALRLTYAIIPEGIARWTSYHGEVQRERLGLSSAQLATLVDRVVELSSTDPGSEDAPMPPELVSLATRLGRALLPEWLCHEPGLRVVVEPEGALSLLPFELLNVGAAGTYVPLVARHDLVYSRIVRPRSTPTVRGHGLILADAPDADHPSDARSSLAPLPSLAKEVQQARARLPGADVIRGSEISKRSLLRRFARASTIYVAAHLVRDPDAPLFNCFPISFAADSMAGGDRYLDIQDVRGTELRSHPLIVLSSCASGEPFVAGDRTAPSMADAFLDAGASAVIHTRWRVRDESAARTAPALLGAWAARGSGVSGAWALARKAGIEGPRGIRHPFQWAAWSVSVADPVSGWQPTARGFSDASRATAVAVLARQAASPAPAE